MKLVHYRIPQSTKSTIEVFGIPISRYPNRKMFPYYTLHGRTKQQFVDSPVCAFPHLGRRTSRSTGREKSYSQRYSHH